MYLNPRNQPQTLTGGMRGTEGIDKKLRTGITIDHPKRITDRTLVVKKEITDQGTGPRNFDPHPEMTTTPKIETNGGEIPQTKMRENFAGIEGNNATTVTPPMRCPPT